MLLKADHHPLDVVGYVRRGSKDVGLAAFRLAIWSRELSWSGSSMKMDRGPSPRDLGDHCGPALMRVAEFANIATYTGPATAQPNGRQ